MPFVVGFETRNLSVTKSVAMVVVVKVEREQVQDQPLSPENTKTHLA